MVPSSDVFFSANLDYAKKLEMAGLTEPGSYYEYARGKIVVWVPKDSALDLSSGLQSLQECALQKGFLRILQQASVA